MLLFFKTGFGQLLNNCDSVFFAVQIGAYKCVPDSVVEYAKKNNFQIITSPACYDTTVVQKIQVGKTNCYEDAVILLERAKDDGYKKSFLVAFDGKKRITIKKAIELIGYECK